jgi:hypothetical protein
MAYILSKVDTRSGDMKKRGARLPHHLGCICTPQHGSRFLSTQLLLGLPVADMSFRIESLVRHGGGNNDDAAGGTTIGTVDLLMPEVIGTVDLLMPTRGSLVSFTSVCAAASTTFQEPPIQEIEQDSGIDHKKQWTFVVIEGWGQPGD